MICYSDCTSIIIKYLTHVSKSILYDINENNERMKANCLQDMKGRKKNCYMFVYFQEESMIRYARSLDGCVQVISSHG